jgi:enediyne polyketide synthase
MQPAVAIVGMACRYPDARSPQELWENVLAQRRAFRRMPAERMRLSDYWSADRSAPDRTYASQVALIEGYSFDRVRFRVAGATYRAADLAHWLALDVAAQALADAGFPDGDGLPRATTGALVGNTLTGEFSRAHALRLRWPYVRRTLQAALHDEGWSAAQRARFLEQLEESYKAPFAPVGEETLAGGLANTIAGRICNYFDLNGGGYTVDGACSSSLLAVTTACAALLSGDLDVAIAGGVDLSLDPFELVGFAKAGALAGDEMRVYDARSAGFWPGEGCGMIVLMREDDALAHGRPISALIRGWGVSSDGSGGMTRPEADGQLLAIERAYRRAGFGVESVGYFEGHGTGTSVGDATELRALSRARRAGGATDPAAIGSIKANIGHTKAAAGVAGLIKAALAVQHRVLPPTTGCDDPHPELGGAQAALRVLPQAERWSSDAPCRAGVSAMGFGGINVHLVLESSPAVAAASLSPAAQRALRSAQDAELVLLAAADAAALERQIERLVALTGRLSRAELADLSAELARTLEPQPLRAALVAAHPDELLSGLRTLQTWLNDGRTQGSDRRAGVFLGAGLGAPQIGLLFPGQGAPSHLDGGALRRRFSAIDELYRAADLPSAADDRSTAVAQPAIVTASLAGLRALERLGVAARCAIGHSLGELTALCWAGALDEQALIRIARVRGRAMADLGDPTGAMVSLDAGQREVEALINGDPVAIAGLNSARQTVISGGRAAVEAVARRAERQGLHAARLPVSHAFHSPLVAAAARPLADQLAHEQLRPLRRAVLSTVTGALLPPDADLRALLCQQVTAPVRFMSAVSQVAPEIDLWIEVGPGHALSGLVGDAAPAPVIALDAGGRSLRGLLSAVGAAFALGAPIRPDALHAGRLTRPLSLDWQPRFFANPCELAPLPEDAADELIAASGQAPYSDPALDELDEPIAPEQPAAAPSTALDLVRRLVAQYAELPPAAVQDDSRLLSDMHLNSITVSQLVVEAARTLGLARPASPTDYADATVAAIAQALQELAETSSAAPDPAAERAPAGVDAWVRAFQIELVEQPLSRRRTSGPGGAWRIIAPPEHALADRLREALAAAEHGGVLVCLPASVDERHLPLLLEAAQTILAAPGPTRFVLVQHGVGAAAFARTLFWETADVPVCVVNLPPDHPRAVEWVVEEALAASDYCEVFYDAAGVRRTPQLALLPDLPSEPAAPLSETDVLVVTGGGKGITAECALMLARQTGVRLALFGRAQPADDAELAANLARFAAADVRFMYRSVDVTDVAAVRDAIGAVEAELGPVTALMHGAARNVPQLLRTLDLPACLATLAPKIEGARNVLAAIDPDRLRLFVSFSSIIGRMGLAGEAHYALANEWLTALTERWQADHPHCRCLAIEWSIWSEVGMGARLGGVDALLRAGITPITPDAGMAMLGRLLAQPLPTVAPVVTGRFGTPPTLPLARAELPLLRFLEQPRIFYPGLELVVDVELSTSADPYLDDHQFRGQRLLPTVFALEAMAQAALALTGRAEPLAFADVRLLHPIVVPEQAALMLRIAALVRAPGRIDLVVRSAETAFQADHIQATCLLDERPAQPAAGPARPELPGVGLDAQQELYGQLFFHRGRFKRVLRYERLTATECVAELGATQDLAWFGPYLPERLILGDPGLRDAAIHAIQACVPDVALLPIGVERIDRWPTTGSGPWRVHARERAVANDTFTYDLTISAADGQVCERWQGLRLRIVGGTAWQGPWIAPLLGPYIERQLHALIPDAAVSIVVERNAGRDRRAQSQAALQRALHQPLPIWHRPDGKPEASGPMTVSAAHTPHLTLASAGYGSISCDLEPIVTRPPALWRELLGPERMALAELIARAANESEADAATRVWAAGECLKKSGAPADAPLVLTAIADEGWIVLAAGGLRCVTACAAVQPDGERLAFAVMAPSQELSWSASARTYDQALQPASGR